MSFVCTVITIALQSGGGTATSMSTDYWEIDLPYSESVLRELREKAIDLALQGPELRARKFKRENVSAVVGFVVLAATADGRVAHLYPGAMP